MKHIEEILRDEGIFVGQTEGDSMTPLIVQGRDSVIISPPTFPLKKYDVPVYKREDRYVMHRIVRVTKKGYVICGDNRAHLERDITDKNIVGVLSAVVRDGKLLEATDDEFKRYGIRAVREWPLRAVRFTVLRVVRKLASLFRRKGAKR